MSEYTGVSKIISPKIFRSPDARSTFPWWLNAVVVVGALLMVMGGLIALWQPSRLVSAHDEITGAVRVYADYFAARALVLAIFLLVALILRASGMLNTLMLLTAFIQLADAIIDCLEGRWIVLPGVIAVGSLFFLGSAWSSGYPFWRAKAWRQER
jgi:hypothetical protein